MDRLGRGLFDFGAGGRGLEGGFISKAELVRLCSTGDGGIFLRGNGERDSDPGLGIGGTLNGD